MSAAEGLIGYWDSMRVQAQLLPYTIYYVHAFYFIHLLAEEQVKEFIYSLNKHHFHGLPCPLFGSSPVMLRGYSMNMKM